MWEVSLTGLGMALIQGLNGVPALYLGVQTNADILTQALFRNLQAVEQAYSGLKTEVSGQIILLSHPRE